MVKELNVVVASSKELGLKSTLTSQVEKMLGERGSKLHATWTNHHTKCFQQSSCLPRSKTFFSNIDTSDKGAAQLVSNMVLPGRMTRGLFLYSSSICCFNGLFHHSYQFIVIRSH
ncbi:hypothetical protein LguiA_033590 [Lonicera macranthoides]